MVLQRLTRRLSVLVLLVFLFNVSATTSHGFKGVPRKRALVFLIGLVPSKMSLEGLINILVESDAIHGYRFYTFLKLYTAMNVFAISQEPTLKALVFPETILLLVAYSLVEQFDEFDSEKVIKELKRELDANEITKWQYDCVHSFIVAFSLLNQYEQK